MAARKSQHVAEYQELLQADETLSNLDRTLDLCEAIIGTRAEWKDGEVRLARIGKAQRAHDEVFSQLSRHVQAFEESAYLQASRRREHEKARLITVRRLLRVQFVYFVKLWGDEHGLPVTHRDLFADACLLLFHQTCYAFLPMLEVRPWQQEHAHILTVLATFAKSCESASDRFQLLGLCAEADGDGDTAGRLYEQALRATRPDDHEYLTALQMVWAHHIGRKRFRDAAAVLVEHYPRVPRAALDEIGKLFADTVTLAESG